MTPALRTVARQLGSRAGRSYVTGPGLQDVLAAQERAARQGYSADVCYWPRPDESYERVAERYGLTLDGLAGAATPARMSVKGSQVGFRSELLAPVLEQAREHDISVFFDALVVHGSDDVFGMLAQALPSGASLGCAVAGRWTRSPGDLEWALEHGLHVRVVKGQYPDEPGLDVDRRRGFLDLVDQAAGRAALVSVATHDSQLAHEAVRRLRDANTPVELEVLYGFPLRRLLRELAPFQVPVRMYLPYGFGRTPYPPRQALRQPATARFMAADVALGAARARVPLPHAAG